MLVLQTSERSNDLEYRDNFKGSIHEQLAVPKDVMLKMKAPARISSTRGRYWPGRHPDTASARRIKTIGRLHLRAHGLRSQMLIR